MTTNSNKYLKVLSASAGSGKTFRLAVEYIKLLIENPVNYKYILAVTFTNKATSEMKDRILTQLYGIAHGLASSKDYLAKIKEDERFRHFSDKQIRENAGKALKNMMHDYGMFRIETIDSFFQSILRELAHELRLSNNLRVDLKTDEILKNAVKTMLRDLKESDNVFQVIKNYVEQKIGENIEWKIEDEIGDFAKHIFDEQFMLHKQKKLREQGLQDKEMMDVPAFDMDEVKKYKNKVFETLRQKKEHAVSKANDFLKTCEESGLTIEHIAQGKNGAYGFLEGIAKGEQKSPGKNVNNCLESAEKWAKKGKYHDLVVHLAGETFMPILKDVLADLDYIKQAKVITKHIYPLMLIGEIDKMVRSLNSDENRFLLADTSYLLNAMIQDSDIPFIYEKSGTKFKYIMIDEFQDTSTLQWKNFVPLLMNCVSIGCECLIVGDVKQSIYRWRNSDWEILNGIKDNEDFKDYVDWNPLEDNYRSAGNVVEFNNAFFSIAALELQKLYDLKTTEKVPDESVLKTEVIPSVYATVVQKVKKNEGKGYVKVECVNFPVNAKVAERKTVEYQRVINNLKELLTRDEIGKRTVVPNDIAILCRENKDIPNIMSLFEEAKRQKEYSMFEGVNIVSDEAFKLKASLAVNVLIAALRAIANPTDKYSLGYLLSIYNKEVKKDETTADLNAIFLKDVNAIKQMLPTAFVNEFPSLSVKPLYELVQNLFEILGLSVIENQSAYLFSFFDKLLNFVCDKPGDIDSFLQYWDETMCEETIPMGELEGIRILSIHKSKGLEFHTVIFPLADWTFTKQGFSTTLWCQPTGEFEGLDLLPVDYGNEANEFFNKENNEERLKTYVDNLNLVYVANTRVRNNLIVISGRNELSENQKKNGGLSEDVAYLMWMTMEKMKESGMHCIDVPLEMSLAEDDEEEKEMSIRQYEKGELLPSKEKVDEEEENVLAQKPADLPITFHQNKMLAGFRQSNQSAEFVKGQYDENDDGNSLSSGYSNDYINQGLLFHYLLSLVHTLDDVDKAFLRVSQEGYFESQEQENSIRKLLRQALQNEQVRGWFAPDWNVVNECAIIDKNDEGIIYEKRPDRVISKPGETIVIDYKTGDSQTVYSKYKEQVKEYIDLLKRAGYENVKGYLWYVMDNKVVPVSDSNND